MERSSEHIDLLVDGEDNGPLNVSLAARDFCVQWHELPEGTLRAMWEMLSQPSGAIREEHVGTIFGRPVHLVEREGIFSLKCSDPASGDLLRIDMSDATVRELIDALADAIESWET